MSPNTIRAVLFRRLRLRVGNVSNCALIFADVVVPLRVRLHCAPRAFADPRRFGPEAIQALRHVAQQRLAIRGSNLSKNK